MGRTKKINNDAKSPLVAGSIWQTVSLNTDGNGQHASAGALPEVRQAELVSALRIGLEKLSSAESEVFALIRDISTNLAGKIDRANNARELAAALSEWEKQLDILSQALPVRLEPLRTRFAQEIDNTVLGERGSHFHVTLSGHPHISNRARLLMKHGDEIRRLKGFDSHTGLIAVAVVIVQTLLAAAMNDAPWVSYFLVMAFAGSILNHTAGMAIHEASHNLAAPTPILNRFISILANLPMALPHQANFERYHLKHHIYLGQPEHDNDLPSPALARWVGNSSARKALWLAFYPLAYSITQKPDSPNSKQVVNILTQLGWDAGIVYFLGPWALAYLLGSSLIGFSALNPVAAHWIDEHFDRSQDSQETYSYYGLLNWLNFNVGYHNEHHDFPDIPGSRLPELHNIAKEHYEKHKSSSSWVTTIWQFITDPKISAHSRIIRTQEAQHRANFEAASANPSKFNTHTEDQAETNRFFSV